MAREVPSYEQEVISSRILTVLQRSRLEFHGPDP
jgi:hypothetical protein